MQYVKPLIDKAAEVCGSDSKLAERMGVHRVVIAEMRSGKRSISPATAAELADIAGEDAREAAIAAILEGAKGTRREGVLRDILGKALAAGVAAMLVISYSEGSNSAMEKIAMNDGAIYFAIHRIYSTLRQIKRRMGEFVLRTNRALAFG